MRELPIPFSAPMVRAILEGRKTATRRVIKPQPFVDGSGNFCWNGWNYGQDLGRRPHVQAIASPLPSSRTNRVLCPYGAPGDRLWVREAWRMPASLDDLSGKLVAEKCLEAGYRKPWAPISFEADGAVSSAKDWREFGSTPGEAVPGRYRHARFMPRWASRITLEVTAVRVERLQDISAEQAIAEGAMAWASEQDTPIRDLDPGDERIAFMALWDGLAKPGTSWDDNPWVWVVEFKRIEKEVPRGGG